MSRFDTVKGFFGQLIHYKDGRRVGESWDGIIPGSKNHYDSSGRFVGYSDPGIIADEIHHNEFGGRVGESYHDDFGFKTHYSDNEGYVGTTQPGIIGETTDIYSSEPDPFCDQSSSDW